MLIYYEHSVVVFYNKECTNTNQKTKSLNLNKLLLTLTANPNTTQQAKTTNPTVYKLLKIPLQ